ncbi:hypothetical protein D9V32_15955 [Mycetocola tolaasinivorans]|uniref:ABC transporter permease n=1 Tax=Mycetocola tolaasinivorans TaxID=76635 RepID=A0A3L6ZVH1_9MICO|nr:hypothetical protein [Mycetocola tolaasinivorans]RLP71849.1 hypothetical protein D9V32_15955 [Mycetocola tolaasinivorans]
MRGTELWREAGRNFSSGASRGLIALIAFLAIVLSIGGMSVRSVVDVAGTADRFRQSGASVFRLDAVGAIDPRACDALNGVDGVDAAGASRAGQALRFAALPDLPTPYFDVTPGLARLLGAAPVNPGAGLIVDAKLGMTLGVGTLPTDTTLVGGSAPVAIAAAYDHPDDGRDATLSGAALGLDSGTEEPFDSCWVRFWPPTDNPLELLSIATTEPLSSGEAVQWNPSLGRSYSPQEAFQALPLMPLTLAAAVIATVLALTGVRMRRLELASARHVGVSRTDLVRIALAETLIWLVPAATLALTALAFLAAAHNPDPLLAAWSVGARVVVAAAAAWWLTVGIATALIRETHLVRYFQQR